MLFSTNRVISWLSYVPQHLSSSPFDTKTNSLTLPAQWLVKVSILEDYAKCLRESSASASAGEGGGALDCICKPHPLVADCISKLRTGEYFLTHSTCWNICTVKRTYWEKTCKRWLLQYSAICTERRIAESFLRNDFEQISHLFLTFQPQSRYHNWHQQEGGGLQKIRWIGVEVYISQSLPLFSHHIYFVRYRQSKPRQQMYSVFTKSLFPEKNLWFSHEPVLHARRVSCATRKIRQQ